MLTSPLVSLLLVSLCLLAPLVCSENATPADFIPLHVAQPQILQRDASLAPAFIMQIPLTSTAEQQIQDADGKVTNIKTVTYDFVLAVYKDTSKGTFRFVNCKATLKTSQKAADAGQAYDVLDTLSC